MRALNNINWSPSAYSPPTWSQGMDGLTSWGPVINLLRDIRWGRSMETAGECPYLNGVFAREITRGLQEGEDPRYLLVCSVLKHFAVYSLEDYHTANGTHVTRENVNNVVSQFDLHDSYYPHFRAAILPVAQGGGSAGGVMMAMNAVNGIPALASSELTNTLKDWSGVDKIHVATDGGNMITWSEF
jgi:beta-glucosidase-like glycosyl hydrolase